jgi:hypothetical protein
MDTSITDESTLVFHGEMRNLRLSAVGHAPEIEHDISAPSEAYEELAEKEVVAWFNYPEVVGTLPEAYKESVPKGAVTWADYPEVIEPPPSAWTDAHPKSFFDVDEPKYCDRWDRHLLSGGLWRLMGPAFWAVGGVLVVIVVAVGLVLGLGLGLGLGMRHTGSSSASTPTTSSTTSSAVSSVTRTVILPKCDPSILYCGWDLIKSRST